MSRTNELCNREAYGEIGVSDLNWERLTLWRALLADFYDVPGYQPSLDRIESVRIDFVAPYSDDAEVAPQALLIAEMVGQQVGMDHHAPTRQSQKCSHLIPRTIESSWWNSIALKGKGANQGDWSTSSFCQMVFHLPRSLLLAALTIDTFLRRRTYWFALQRGRLLPVRNRTTAQLLAREMEILSHDRVYHDALAMACQSAGKSKCKDEPVSCSGGMACECRHRRWGSERSAAFALSLLRSGGNLGLGNMEIRNRIRATQNRAAAPHDREIELATIRDREKLRT